jgi:hypothetical protein
MEGGCGRGRVGGRIKVTITRHDGAVVEFSSGWVRFSYTIVSRWSYKE